MANEINYKLSTNNYKLLAIVGPTASGKSALAMQIASEFNGEIIAADSRTIYKGMDIGTAKPSPGDRKEVPHWGLDLVQPGETFSASQYQDYANNKIEDIQKRGKLPILVGGSGLYIDSVLYDFQFGSKADPKLRAELEKLDIKQLQQIILERQLDKPENFKNRRHIIRTIERQGRSVSKKKLRPKSLIIGLIPPDEELKSKINQRAELIMKSGVVNETAELVKRYGRENVLKTGGLVYKICVRLLSGEIDEQTATTTFQKLDWQYARRQRTWFKRNPDIKWFNNPQTAFLHLKKVLST